MIIHVLSCGNIKNLRKCICKKLYCTNCISNNKNEQCKKECFLFNNDKNTLTSFFQISKFPLPKNFEAKIHFIKVDMIRAGITFDTNIINEKDYAIDSPPYNIYYQGAIKFYDYKKGWLNHFNLGKIKDGDNLIIKIMDGKLQFLLNNQFNDKYYPLKNDEINGKDMYLLIHRRNETANCELEYIYDLSD